jgi:hypothetical protein
VPVLALVVSAAILSGATITQLEVGLVALVVGGGLYLFARVRGASPGRA